MSKKILFVGESWIKHIVHIKGFDSFTTSEHGTGIEYIKKAIEKCGYELTWIESHAVGEKFPLSLEELKTYDAVVLSDIGSNSLLLPPAVFTDSQRIANRLELIKQYVLDGGAFLMIGGYMSFTGIDAKTRYGQTPIKDILPVECLDVDDRSERPEGITPVITNANHEILKGLPTDNWPHVLGYNRVKALPEHQVVATVGGEPFIAVGDFGKGRSAIITTDCAPHWAPPEFVSWEHYDQIWKSIFEYIIK